MLFIVRSHIYCDLIFTAKVDGEVMFLTSMKLVLVAYRAFFLAWSVVSLYIKNLNFMRIRSMQWSANV